MAGPKFASGRFQQDISLQPQFSHLLKHHKAVGDASDDNRTIEQALVRYPKHGVLKGRMLAKQAYKLLRTALSRKRPQSRSSSTAHDQGNNPVGHTFLQIETPPGEFAPNYLIALEVNV